MLSSSSPSLAIDSVPIVVQCLLYHLLPVALVQCWAAHFLHTCSTHSVLSSTHYLYGHPLLLFPSFILKISVLVSVFNFLSLCCWSYCFTSCITHCCGQWFTICTVHIIIIADCCSNIYTFDVFCLQGYQGMVDGGDNIQLAEWKTVSNILNKVYYSVTDMCGHYCYCFVWIFSSTYLF